MQLKNKNFLKTSFSFLPYADLTYKLCRNIPLFDYKNHPDSEGADNNYFWPGVRSDKLIKASPFLYLNLLNQAEINLGLDKSLYNDIDAYISVRYDTDNDKDFIHKDSCDTIIIYLSPTNLQSGTTLYTEDDNVLVDVSFKQNTAIYFDGDIKHKSKLNFGDNIDNGRMTINIFCWRK